MIYEVRMKLFIPQLLHDTEEPTVIEYVNAKTIISAYKKARIIINKLKEKLKVEVKDSFVYLQAVVAKPELAMLE